MKNIKKIMTMMLLAVNITQLAAQSENTSESSRMASDEAQMKIAIESKLADRRQVRREAKFGDDSEKINAAPSEKGQATIDARVEKILQRKMKHLASIDARIEKLLKTKVNRQNKDTKNNTVSTEKLAEIDARIEKLRQRRMDVVNMKNSPNKNNVNSGDNAVTIQSEGTSQPEEAGQPSMKEMIEAKIKARGQNNGEQASGGKSSMRDELMEKIKARRAGKNQHGSSGESSMKDELMKKMEARRGSNSQTASAQ